MSVATTPYFLNGGIVYMAQSLKPFMDSLTIRILESQDVRETISSLANLTIQKHTNSLATRDEAVPSVGVNA
jgi:hypothetical protein